MNEKLPNGIVYYKLVSPYNGDSTKNCKLQIKDIDDNFYYLRMEDLKDVEFVYDKDDENNKTLIFTKKRYDVSQSEEDKIYIPLKDVTYNLDVDTISGYSGVTLTIKYDGKEGDKEVKISDIVTADVLMKLVGDNVMTRVITDGTLKGDGRIHNPLGLKGIEKTGFFAPVDEVIDLTKGGELPKESAYGTRYATVEYVNDYGFLYNGNGIKEIQNRLDKEGKGWHIPSKDEWDTLLNSIETCDADRTHGSWDCHTPLGRLAGTFLKSQCGWGDTECDCNSTLPVTSCTEAKYDEIIDTEEDIDSEYPMEKEVGPNGIDKYGMRILPSGWAQLKKGVPTPHDYKENSLIWTSTQVSGLSKRDYFVKEFAEDLSGVMQRALCDDNFYSVRLVKKYDGCNHFDVEYIDGIPYETLLFPGDDKYEGLVWLASNFASDANFKDSGDDIQIAKVNNGVIRGNRKAIFLNEWNGNSWEKKQLVNGDTFILRDGCTNRDIEYRVGSDGKCDQYLYDTDESVIERVLTTLLPLIETERDERISADTRILDALEEERQVRLSADTEINDALTNEINERVSADERLNEALRQETEERQITDTEIVNALNQEIKERVSGDTVLMGEINRESEIRQEQDKLLNDALTNEINERVSADERLNEALRQETEERQNTDTEIVNALKREEEERLNADIAINNALTEEIKNRTEGDAAINGRLIKGNKDYTLISAGNADEPNLILESNDGTNDIRIYLNTDFGEI